MIADRLRLPIGFRYKPIGNRHLAIGNRLIAFSLFGRGHFDSYETQSRFEISKKLNLIQKRIEPAIRDAVMHVEWLGVMNLMMRRTEDEPCAL